MSHIDHLSGWQQQRALAARLCPGLVGGRHLRLEYDSVEEGAIRDLERHISEERKKGLPVDALIEKHERTVASWIERLERQSEETTDGRVRKDLERQRERVISEYRGRIR
jgi:hypothetical protein